TAALDCFFLAELRQVIRIRRGAIPAGCVSLAVVLLLPRADRANAEPAAGTPSSLLEPIVVTATRSPESLDQVPASITVVGRPHTQEARPTAGLEEPVDRVPGAFVQNSGNFAQDARIQIRGFGTRAAFGIREIKVLLDGLPETLPDGQTELDAIDLGAIRR